MHGLIWTACRLCITPTTSAAVAAYGHRVSTRVGAPATDALLIRVKRILHPDQALLYAVSVFMACAVTTRALVDWAVNIFPGFQAAWLDGSLRTHLIATITEWVEKARSQDNEFKLYFTGAINS